MDIVIGAGFLIGGLVVGFYSGAAYGYGKAGLQRWVRLKDARIKELSARAEMWDRFNG